MPGSDDQYDQVHTYSQDHAGKSKTTKPAVREIGRDGAPVRLYVGEARDSASIRTPPSGVGYIFFDQSDDAFKQIDSAGTVTSLAGGKSTEQVQDDVGSIMNEPLDYDDAAPSYDISLSSALAVNGGNLDVAADGIVQSMIAANAVGNTQMADDAITPTEVDGSGGTDGQVLTSTGTEAQWESAARNVPDWTEDGNSPVSHTGSGSVTYNLASQYDLVEVHITNLANEAGITNAEDLEMTLNGVTTGVYDYAAYSGTNTTQASSVPVSYIDDAVMAGHLVIQLTGTWNVQCSYWVGSGTNDASRANSGGSNNLTSPLDSITFATSGGSNWGATIEVYGRTSG